MNLNIALAGNPNSGLTTLFNQMTGGIQHTGVFSTPDNKTKEGPVKNHKGVNVIELPGMYSLSEYTVDDLSNRHILLQGKPDVIINIVDATNFERNLYLTLQLMELGIPMVLALNMMDEVQNNKISIDLMQLSSILTIPILPISASKNRGIHDLIHYAIEASKNRVVPQNIDFCKGHVHTAIHAIGHIIEENAIAADLPLRFCCTKIVEGDKPLIGELNIHNRDLIFINEIIEDMEEHLDTDREAAIADMRYAFIEDVCMDAVQWSTESTKEHARSLKIDKILTDKFLGIPIFLGIMFFVFFLTFGSIGTWLSEILSIGVDWTVLQIGNGLMATGASDALYSLVINGICAGVGSVISFLPIIAVLFFLLSILEDSGYMPRVAFVMDKLLGKIGLSGRSIVPMLIGFGCSVPAIMATRSLPSKRDQRLTITIIPFMSCSAKLPLYAMITAAFFAKNSAAIMVALYVTGILVAIIVSLIFNRTVFKGEPVPFIMVLPPYRLPAYKSVMLRVWENVKGFIKKAFTVIFLATIVIWFLQSFDFGLNMVTNPENSILAAIGKFVAPIFAPLGFGDWRAATALITGLSAKEAVVSTMAVLTGATGTGSLSVMLGTMFTPLSAFCFLVFCLLYMPCIATLTTIRREMGGWRYAFTVVLFQTAVAWIVSFIIYNIGGLFI
ncbi:MAG: ferrous iron transport protein B [Anaerovoracaceae bacterium]